MRRGFLVVALTLGVAGQTWAATPAPEYTSDPFGDADFAGTPLILEVSHPTKDRGELAVLFSTSMIDKYTAHTGGLVDFTYHFLETLGAGISVGFLHGALTNIVTDAEGILGNKTWDCRNDASKCGSIDPNVPDYRQITGLADLILMWSPLYGKINVVSEMDVNLQLYGLVGAGVNGTRRITAEPVQPVQTPTDYRLRNASLFDGGAFDDARMFMLDWLALRAEARGVVFRDEFDFGEGPEGYTSLYWFGQAGLAFMIF